MTEPEAAARLRAFIEALPISEEIALQALADLAALDAARATPGASEGRELREALERLHGAAAAFRDDWPGLGHGDDCTPETCYAAGALAASPVSPAEPEPFVHGGRHDRNDTDETCAECWAAASRDSASPAARSAPDNPNRPPKPPKPGPDREWA